MRHLHLALMAAFLIAVTHFDAIAQDRNSPQPTADTSGLNFHQFGLLAVQDGGRRKPIDTFSRETLIRITARSTYTDKAGRKWQPNDFIFSAALETRDWRNEPMVVEERNRRVGRSPGVFALLQRNAVCAGPDRTPNNGHELCAG